MKLYPHNPSAGIAQLLLGNSSNPEAWKQWPKNVTNTMTQHKARNRMANPAH